MFSFVKFKMVAKMAAKWQHVLRVLLTSSLWQSTGVTASIRFQRHFVFDLSDKSVLNNNPEIWSEPCLAL